MQAHVYIYAQINLHMHINTHAHIHIYHISLNTIKILKNRILLADSEFHGLAGISDLRSDVRSGCEAVKMRYDFIHP